MSDLETYRSNARTWLESVTDAFGRAARTGLSVEQDLALGRRYQRAKFDAGYAGINWSKDVGGQGLTHIEKVAFDTEEMVFGMPNGYFGISLGMPVPILIRFGADPAFMKERVLAALKGEEIWCQLFSEPAGGSDLAGLRTRAEVDGYHRPVRPRACPTATFRWSASASGGSTSGRAVPRPRSLLGGVTHHTRDGDLLTRFGLISAAPAYLDAEALPDRHDSPRAT